MPPRSGWGPDDQPSIRRGRPHVGCSYEEFDRPTAAIQTARGEVPTTAGRHGRPAPRRERDRAADCPKSGAVAGTSPPHRRAGARPPTTAIQTTAAKSRRQDATLTSRPRRERVRAADCPKSTAVAGTSPRTGTAVVEGSGIPRRRGRQAGPPGPCGRTAAGWRVGAVDSCADFPVRRATSPRRTPAPAAQRSSRVRPPPDRHADRGARRALRGGSSRARNAGHGTSRRLSASPRTAGSASTPIPALRADRATSAARLLLRGPGRGQVRQRREGGAVCSGRTQCDLR